MSYIVIYTCLDCHDYGEDTYEEFERYDSKQEIIDALTEIAKLGNESTFVAIYEVPKNLVDEISADMEAVEKYRTAKKKYEEEKREANIEEENQRIEVYERERYEELKKKFEG